MQNVMQIATNAGHTAQNDGRTTQNDGRTRKMTAGPRKMMAATNLMFAKVQRGGSRSPPGPRGAPYPILEKTLVSRNNF